MNQRAGIRRRQLAEALRTLRGKRTSADVQAGTGITPSKLSRIENCQVRANPHDVQTLCEFYDLAAAETAGMVKAAEQAFSATVLRDYIGKGWSQSLVEHLQLEQEAWRIESWTIDLVPGLLQTRETSRALINSRPDVDPDTCEERLNLRRRRQERVRHGELTLWAVIGETVLHQRIGGPLVLAEQLEYLADPPANVTVQILPFSTGVHAGLGSSFHIFSFESSSKVVYQDTIQSGLYQDDEETVINHQSILDSVKASAYNVEESAHTLRARAAELRHEAEEGTQ